MLPTILVPSTHRRRNEYGERHHAAVSIATQRIGLLVANALEDVYRIENITAEDIQARVRKVAEAIVNGTLATMRGGTYE